MKIAAVQLSATDKVQANIEKISSYLTDCAAAGARLAIFPEASMYAFGKPGLAAATREYAASWRSELSRLAVQEKITIIAGGFAEADDPQDSRISNQLFVAYPDGRSDSYQKIHLYDAFGFKESDTVSPGQEPVLIEVDGVKIGLATCYDVRFPKLYAEYGRAGAQIVVTPASWAGGPGKINQWQLLTSTRALDSNTFVVAVDQADPRTLDSSADWSQPTGVGYSRVVSPFGETLGELGAEEGALIVELDLSLTEQAAKKIPVLSNAKLGY